MWLQTLTRTLASKHWIANLIITGAFSVAVSFTSYFCEVVLIGCTGGGGNPIPHSLVQALGAIFWGLLMVIPTALASLVDLASPKVIVPAIAFAVLSVALLWTTWPPLVISFKIQAFAVLFSAVLGVGIAVTEFHVWPWPTNPQECYP